MLSAETMRKIEKVELQQLIHFWKTVKMNTLKFWDNCFLDVIKIVEENSEKVIGLLFPFLVAIQVYSALTEQRLSVIVAKLSSKYLNRLTVNIVVFRNIFR